MSANPSKVTRGLEEVEVKISPIKEAIKRSSNALGDLNDLLLQLEDRISPVLSSSSPESCENDATNSRVSGESGVYNEIEEISNRIWRACARVREIRDRIEL
jgi:ribosome maturation protein Sdo1